MSQVVELQASEKEVKESSWDTVGAIHRDGSENIDVRLERVRGRLERAQHDVKNAKAMAATNHDRLNGLEPQVLRNINTLDQLTLKVDDDMRKMSVSQTRLETKHDATEQKLEELRAYVSRANWALIVALFSLISTIVTAVLLAR